MVEPINKKSALLWLKKAVGIINKVMTMIENDEYCVDIASQVNASMWLLKGVNTTLLENHLACCWPKFLNATEAWKKDAFIKELVRAWNVSNK